MILNGIEVPVWLLAGGFLLLSTLLMLLIKTLIIRAVQRWVDRSSFRFDTLLLSSIRFPLNLAILVLNLLLLKQLMIVLSLDVSAYGALFSTGAQILVILALIVFMDRFTSGALNSYANSEGIRNSKSLLTGIVRSTIYVIGALVLLGSFGIPITPIIASLGIGSLAVALALQPTLENFFSGVQLVVDKPIRVGDFIELESGEQGFVDRIGWRSTWIRMLPNNTVIMPNSALSNSKVINYFYPEKELSVPVEVGVHYDSDLERVEQVTLEVAREVLQSHEWGVDDYETFVVYHTFDNSSINFTVMLRAKEYFNRFWVKSAFIKALHRRYREEGITIPFPITALNLSQEQAAGTLEAIQTRAADPGSTRKVVSR